MRSFTAIFTDRRISFKESVIHDMRHGYLAVSALMVKDRNWWESIIYRYSYLFHISDAQDEDMF